MSEHDVVKKTDNPNTITSLVNDLKRIGIQPGMTVLVHSSLSSIGWVCGGSVSVIKSLEEVLTEEGTLVMPTHSGDLSDPSHWCNPAVPKEWWEIIKNEMPVFDKSITPTRAMGKISECFRKQNNVLRSNHPTASFAAWGKNKEYIIQDNHFDYSQNDFSPLGRIYELNGFILLLGVGYCNNTSFHLAEYRAKYKGKKIISDGMPIIENGKRVWRNFEDIQYYVEDFEKIGNDFENMIKINKGNIGKAESKLFSQKLLVDFSVKWMEKNRELP